MFSEGHANCWRSDGDEKQNGVRIEQMRLEVGGDLADCQLLGHLPEDACYEPLSMWGGTEEEAEKHGKWGIREKPERSEGGKGSVAEGMCLLFAEAVSGLHGLQTDVHPDGGMSTFSYLSVGSASRRTQQFLSPCSKISV